MFSYTPDEYFSTDEAPEPIARQRREAMRRLADASSRSSAESITIGAGLESGISDVGFTSRYRVPFPYADGLPKSLRYNAVVTESRDVQLRDIDGNWRYDLSGSYGVNVFGYDFYKHIMEAGLRRVQALGPVLGPYHPVIRDNVQALRAISGLDEVSFHMSGTEAVMQAVRLARYHTGRRHLVRLCGAYHGWWDGVQPGVGNTRAVNDVYTLADLSERTLKVLETRRDIACVLINPLQALHPNSDAPGDSTLTASTRAAGFDRERYSRWLQKIRDICTRRKIVLIVDEVFTGFRLAKRGAQEYFGIQADLVTYGKTLGGGLPVGVLCGRAELMKRYQEDAPANVSFARGTFNSHPMVMACMAEFLARIETAEIQAVYEQADALWNRRVADLNERLEAQQLPVRFANLHSVITTLYTRPSRYNWMFQFYLRAEGLELAWIGSGRFIMSLGYTDQAFAEVADSIVRAAQGMDADGWWWSAPHLSNRWIQRRMLRDMLAQRWLPKGRRQPQAVPQAAKHGDGAG
ncbi:MAG: aminotransferase class III-fold pyridoxal phosphate-dependent enzyme [Chromatiales bacterium]|nr:aminotransferase class III-fold pyridoxal phosphate-dependent enzyme [Chromatiales bacterium]